jgi:hypothetical protein
METQFPDDLLYGTADDGGDDDEELGAALLVRTRQIKHWAA